MPDPNALVSPPVTPYLTVGHAQGAIAFYVRAFGAEEMSRQTTPDGTKIIHAALRLANGGLVMLSDDFSDRGPSRDPKKVGGGSVTLHLDLPDVKATWATAQEAGAVEIMPLAVQFWGDEYGIIEDPFGHRWSLATRGQVRSQAELDAGAAEHFPSKDRA